MNVREVHHRVKNNLQTMASLLRLQMRQVDSPAAKEALGTAVNRILSMATVHELLARENHDAVEVVPLLRRITEENLQNFLLPGQEVEHRIEAEAVRLPQRQATALALVVNELVVNALKHAFPGGRKGHIDISLREREGSWALTVADNGVGIAASVPLQPPETLGIKIVQTLCRGDLRGDISFRRSPGTTVTITFPKIEKEEEDDP